MEQMLLDYIKNEYLDDEDEDDIELGPTTPLISSGIVDSFSMVSLKTFLETKFEIKLSDDEATTEAFDTVESIMTLVNKHLAAKGA